MIRKPRTFVVCTSAGILAAFGCIQGLLPAQHFFQVVGDYTKHLEFAEEMYRTHRIVVPHFLFHVLTIGVVKLANMSFQSAAFVVLGVFCGLTGLLVYRETATALIPPQSSGWALWRQGGAALALAIGVLLMEPILRPGAPHIYQLGYFWAEPYENPTYALMKPLSLASVASALGFFKPVTPSRFAVIGAALATAAGALAKPSFVICLIPAVIFLGALRSVRHEAVDWRAIILGFIVPGAVIVLLQYYISYSGFGPQGSYQNTIVFAPFKFFRVRQISYFPVKFALSVAFPAAVYVLYWRSARRDLALNFSVLLFAIATGYAVLLVEAQKTTHGNLLWGAYVTLFILYLYSAIFLVRQLATESRTGMQLLRNAAAIALLLAHVSSGILIYNGTLHQ